MAGSLAEPLLADERDKSGEGITKRVATASPTLLDGINYVLQKTFSRQQEKTDPCEDVDRPSIWARAFAPLASFAQQLDYLTVPAKGGLAAAICSILCFASGPLSVFNKNGLWAVVTADVVFESTVGLTFSKGINRTLGTLAAAALALLVNYAAPLCGAYEPYFVVFFVFLGASLATMFKFRHPFKDRWNLAVAMSMIAFHILILSKTEYKDKIRLPMIRLALIVIGFLLASVVNLSIVPKYCGITINELVAKNFERAGNVMERCVTTYCEGTTLGQVHDIITGKSKDDNIHMSFHEIVSADSEVNKLMKAVPFEPCHGKFFFGYPWDLYDDITENLRYTLYDVVALDSCLRAEVQAPKDLRRIFEEEFQCIGKECGQVFRLLGQSIRDMHHCHIAHDMQRAEEGALLLQHKIVKYTTVLLGGVLSDTEMIGAGKEQRKEFDKDRMSISFEESYEDFRFSPPQSDYSKLSTQLRTQSENSKSNNAVQSKGHMVDGHEDSMQQQDLSSGVLDTTAKLSALSLVKFSSLLIELVAKAKYMVSIVDELGFKARFEDYKEGSPKVETPNRGPQQV